MTFTTFMFIIVIVLLLVIVIIGIVGLVKLEVLHRDLARGVHQLEFELDRFLPKKNCNHGQ